MLLQQLLKFKDEPKFKEYGFAIGGPYNKWLKSVESLRDSTPTGLRSPIPFEVRTTPSDLLIIGMDFMREGETDFTRRRLPELKDRIGYAAFLNPKPTEETAKPKTRTWHDLTGKYSVDATLVKKTETHVVLRKADGKTVQVPIAKLSAADVKFASGQTSP
ncbi:SHD1 domain-containing protein [Novipirellula sp. SH528]|uniref:SHD1 domain-containing protein n=1 Tax=Novipirellula sp. SH528 TaxID=3454466 RepID=UPI003FA182A4